MRNNRPTLTFKAQMLLGISLNILGFGGIFGIILTGNPIFWFLTIGTWLIVLYIMWLL